MTDAPMPARPSSNPAAPVIVTGLSGAGMTSVLKTLEDMGYEVFDNFPLPLLAPLVAETRQDGMPIAVGIDARTRGFSPEDLIPISEQLGARLVFLVCDDSILQKRFTETRRRHPLAKDRPVSAGIAREREWLQPLRAVADMVLDTTDMSVHDLRHVLEDRFGKVRSGALTVSLMSFGYRFGIPREADIVMDVRFLSNPHWVKTLRPLTGQDADVGVYVAKDPEFSPFLDHFRAMLQPLLPRYAHEGKSYLTIALGCTGGRHRSVYAAEQLLPWLREQGYPTNLIHRDLPR